MCVYIISIWGYDDINQHEPTIKMANQNKKNPAAKRKCHLTMVAPDLEP